MSYAKTLIIMMTLLMAATAVQAGAIHPYKCDGTATDTFIEGEDLCVYGTGFEPDTMFDLYVVEDGQSGPIAPETPKTEVTTTSSGILTLTKIWESLKKGFFDIIADIDRDGQVGEGDVVNIGEGAGVTVNGEDVWEEKGPDEIPEFGTVTAALALIGANYFIWKKRRSA